MPTNTSPTFDYLRAIYEDGTTSDWVNLAKPKHLIRWERENPDTPVPTTVEHQMQFLHMVLNLDVDFDVWTDSIEGLEQREFELGKANA